MRFKVFVKVEFCQIYWEAWEVFWRILLRVNEVFQRTAMKGLLVKYKDLSRHINPVVISFHMTAIVGPFFVNVFFKVSPDFI